MLANFGCLLEKKQNKKHLQKEKFFTIFTNNVFAWLKIHFQ